MLWHNTAHCLPAVVEDPWSHDLSVSSRQREHSLAPEAGLSRAGGRDSGPFPPRSHLGFPWRETCCVSVIKLGSPAGKGILVGIPVEFLLGRRWEGLTAQICEVSSGVDTRTFLGFSQGSGVLI